ncbi:unnamed protein product [Arctia plantaginis]|uniref:Uncharacterized protein n=1 Tax=Arctia plantaginis TaxID=874455 RepID=A0A8S1BRQ4_ARCPL|nr:unnamed protein product [Arctia plantaginis]
MATCAELRTSWGNLEHGNRDDELGGETICQQCSTYEIETKVPTYIYKSKACRLVRVNNPFVFNVIPPKLRAKCQTFVNGVANNESIDSKHPAPVDFEGFPSSPHVAEQHMGTLTW